ncbi:MAG: ATP-binding protein [Lachnospiraceae bacterium]|nr:ATP-binding protein [Lachnospiraceae bacterium]MBP3469903.1 ATP-binding protein [Lachnospiraceae bacterium]
MGYSYSQLDKDNFKWFTKDIAAKSLVSMQLSKGMMRGLKRCYMEMSYPISAIAGKNGSGKSTLLAMACCAYHNSESGYLPYDRNKTYYTFSDFFIQTSDENKIEGVEIWYKSVNHWRGSKGQEFDGIGQQRRYKKQGGKWNKYQKRANRNVIFSGIQRIVPPGERKTERTYSGKFESVKLDEQTQQKILEIASRVLNRKYESLDLRTVDRRRLFVVDRNSAHYSGFNMGAGENAIFTLLIELFSAGKNTLLVIDEIELGLHEEAQRRLVEELKKICLELHCQVICSTHSAAILDSLPPEARYYVESDQQKTEISKGISSAYALGKLSGGKEKELIIFTEDEVGKAVVLGTLSQQMRERVNIIPIGSDQAVLRQLSACYREGRHNCMAFLDGDKQVNDAIAKKQVKNHLEGRVGPDYERWIGKRICYLPGEAWPERFIVTVGKDYAINDIAKLWRMEEGEVENFLNGALLEEKHKEFRYLSGKTSQKEEVIQNDIIRCVSAKKAEMFDLIEKQIAEVLEDLIVN